MLKKINTNQIILKDFFKFKILKHSYNYIKYITAILIFKDMLLYTQIWRQVRGYSKNNQRSHSNNKNNKKTKLINNFRLKQFYKLFGKKRRDIFPTLILAEYTNRLWYTIWNNQWKEAWDFILMLAEREKKSVKFDPVLLSKNIITGVKNIKKKKKHNTAKKKILLVANIGLPIFFNRFLYNFKNNCKFAFNLQIAEETRKKMGKKKKKIKNNSIYIKCYQQIFFLINIIL